MWSLREQVSLLMSHGHPYAEFYPIHRVWEEASIVTQRVNRVIATEALALQITVLSVMTKDGQKEFKKLIKRLTDGG